MKYLIFVLLCAQVLGQTNLYDLELVGISEPLENPGQIEVLFNMETTNVRERLGSENILVSISNTADFMHPLIANANAYRILNNTTVLEERYLFPIPLSDGRWFVKIALSVTGSVVDIIKTGSGPGDGWTYPKNIMIDHGFESPVLEMPVNSGEAYSNDELILRWNLSTGVESYFLEASDHPDFLAGNGFINIGIPLSHSDRDYYTLDLAQFGEGYIYFRIKGVLIGGSSTPWSYSQLLYEKSTLSYYYFPWVAENDRNRMYVSIDTGNATEDIQVDFGVRPEGGDGYGSEIFWRTQMVRPGKIFMKNISDILLMQPIYIHQRVLTIRASHPILVTVHQHVQIDPTQPSLRNTIKTTDHLDKGYTLENVVSGFELDPWHTPSIVIGNFDQNDYHDRRYANVRWVLSWNDENGQTKELKRNESVPPQDNVVIMFTQNNFPSLPDTLLGTLRVYNDSPNVPVTTYYSLNNNPENGAQFFNFMMARQIK